MQDKLSRVKLALLAMQRHSWEQGTAMQAFLELGDMDTVVLLAKEAVYRARPDGRAAVIGGNNAVTDPCAVGEALLHAASHTGDKDLSAGCEALLDWALHKAPRNERGVVYHLGNSRQFWADSTYMLPPFLAAAGHPKEALHNMYGYWDTLYDPAARLMCHMWDDEAQEFVRAAHWGAATGWTLAAIARLQALLPDACKADKERLAGMAVTLIEGLLPYLRADGLFHDVVDEPDSFIETNLSQMLAYTLYRGTGEGWLDKAYLPTAQRLRKAAHEKLDEYGLVQDVCGAPDFDKPGVSPEGQAFLLLMEAAAAKVS